jgi:hypothetical protein
VGPPDTSWRLTDPELVWREWPDEPEVAVFSPGPATVHLLTRAARILLERLAAAPLPESRLVDLIADVSGLPIAEVRQVLPELVGRLEDAELIERVSS